MKTSNHKLYIMLFVCVSIISPHLYAQTVDSVIPIREFLQISSTYKQIPAYVELEMKNSSNFIVGEQDTLHAFGKFYLLPDASYMQFGELEQLVTDSIALLVTSRMQRIIVQTDTKSLRNQIEAFSGGLLKDESVTALSKRYKGEIESGTESTLINLSSRKVLYGSSFPEETIQMQYDNKTKQPLQMTEIRRVLVPLDEEAYQKLKGQANMEGYLLSIVGKGFFLIKEQATNFSYKKIMHDANIKIPVSVSDRIVKNSSGEFEPVKAFENYVITTN